MKLPKSRVLLIGAGAREHAIATKLSEDAQCEHVWVCPGNAGTELMAKCTNMDIAISDFHCLVQLVKDEGINLVVVGPEVPLADGIVDHIEKHCDCAVFGPNKQAAAVEADKAFAKQIMFKYGIPTAEYIIVKNMEEAIYQIQSCETEEIVVKANGLCAGKGVFVCPNKVEAVQAVHSIFRERKFGAAGDITLLEESLTGPEISVMAFTDGVTTKIMPPVQDHKRLMDGDKGPNTGGMGAYCPCPMVSASEMEYIEEHIINRMIQGLNKEGIVFKGVLFAGIMLTENGPKVLEFNCRFGDPETQVVLPLLTTPLLEVMKACCDPRHCQLVDLNVQWMTGKSVCDVVVVSEGYPGSITKGHKIALDLTDTTTEYVLHAGTGLNKEGCLTAQGGRVVNVIAVADTLQQARQTATENAAYVRFDGAFYRHDIAMKASTKNPLVACAYAAAGVSIDEGNKLVQMLKPVCQMTRRSGCAVKGSLIGGFAAEFDLAAAGYRKPVLMMGMDGVGTKLELATITRYYSGIGQDLVAMCANDILCHGAEPLAFLDYYVTGKLDSMIAFKIVEGVAEACRQAGCALVGGETAEMPGVYGDSQWDIAGTIIGALESGVHPKLPLVDSMSVGDLVIGLPSSGLHSNGFSLVRKILNDHFKGDFHFDIPCPWDPVTTLGKSLLTPTTLYVKQLLPLIRANKILGLAHITGGGLAENLSRVIPAGLCAQVDCCKWPKQEVFHWLNSIATVSLNSLLRTFNCGIGMVAIVRPRDYDAFKFVKHYVIGTMCRRELDQEPVILSNVQQGFEQVTSRSSSIDRMTPPAITVNDEPISGDETEPQMKKVAILISGTGSNMESLINASHNSSVCQIALVISNRPGVRGIERAQDLGVRTKVIDHTKFKPRAEYDELLHKELVEHEIDVVCLAGFMRLLGAEFVEKWNGRLINIHPSLLPAFKGANAHAQVLSTGVEYTGCTVHYVDASMDGGAIISQSVCAVLHNDTIETLSERVKQLEHSLFPQVLLEICRGNIQLTDGQVVKSQR